MMFPFAKKALSNLFSKPSTVPYPEVEAPAKTAYRGRIAYDPEKCVNCGMCIKVCSPGAIERTAVPDPEAGGEHITYTFDLTSCTFCGSCQDFCSTKAIVMTEDYHMVAEDARDLRVEGTRFKKDVKGRLTCDQDLCVYCGLCARNCPENAITVDRASKTWMLKEEECVKCGRCIEKCPKKCLSFAEGGEEGVILGDACVYCTLCAKNCPVGAIQVDRASKTWGIDREACIKCGQCISACPRKTLRMGPLSEDKPAPAEETKEHTIPEAAAEIPQAEDKTKAAPGEAANEAPAEASGESGVILGPDCIYCTACARKCPMEAITVDRDAKTWEIDRDKCVLCGVCVSTCPKKTLSIN